MNADWDVIVVGAGPAGLSAALYLARFRRRVLVLHDGKARAARIPLTHNVPGYPDGVAGPQLIADMVRHAERFGAAFEQMEVATARHAGDIFVVADSAGSERRSRSLILATGIELNQIALDHDVHEAAIAAGVLRYCPVCDGYEHIGKRIGVVGCDAQGAGEALFLRTFSDDVTLIPQSFVELDAETRQHLRDAGVRVIEQPVARYAPNDREFAVFLEEQDAPLSFDVIYPALGIQPRNRLARSLDSALSGDKVVPGGPFGGDIPGLYAAGDIVEGLDQISVAMGHGAVAATKAHNWLRMLDGATLA